MNRKMTESYKGWPNWATWNMNLWLSNTESDYHFIEEEVERLRDTEVIIEDNIEVVDEEQVELGLIEFLVHHYGNYRTPDMSSLEDVKAVDWQRIAEGWLS